MTWLNPSRVLYFIHFLKLIQRAEGLNLIENVASSFLLQEVACHCIWDVSSACLISQGLIERMGNEARPALINSLH